MGDSTFLMFPQGDFRVHTGENDMASVILAGAGAVHFLVVLAYQGLPPFRVSPNPVLEGIPNGLLFLCGQGGFLGVQHPAFLAVCVLNGVINANIPEIQ